MTGFTGMRAAKTRVSSWTAQARVREHKKNISSLTQLGSRSGRMVETDD